MIDVSVSPGYRFFARKVMLHNTPHESLVAELVNNHYNSWIRDWCDEKDHDTSGGIAGGKWIPYIGWFWRDVDWANLSITVGDCGDMVGFMENNKWGYPQRTLTKEEAITVVDLLENAMEISRRGGLWSEIEAATRAALHKLWDHMQTLGVPDIHTRNVAHQEGEPA